MEVAKRRSENRYYNLSFLVTTKGEKMEESENWYEEDKNGDPEISFKEYELSAVPNDFNVNTIFDFIESGVVKIPGFQRNYVWDKKRASKLIESIIIGIPIPQIFLWEKGRNDYVVIDGQQRLMTLYYFRKGRFPKREARARLRMIFNSHGEIPGNILHDNQCFDDFILNLKIKDLDPENPLHGLKYKTLGQYKSSFDLKTIRNIFIKQLIPPKDDSAVFELFNRLNTGGVNLKQQEIRSSLYHSGFYEMLNKINLAPKWRRLVGIAEPDIHMKDIEYLLRGFAMLKEESNYKGSILKHLNSFSKKTKSWKSEQIEYLEKLFEAFLKSSEGLDPNPFTLKTKKFNISIYESVFVALCSSALAENDLSVKSITQQRLQELKSDQEFLNASEAETGRKTNVVTRLKRARAILG